MVSNLRIIWKQTVAAVPPDQTAPILHSLPKGAELVALAATPIVWRGQPSSEATLRLASRLEADLETLTHRGKLPHGLPLRLRARFTIPFAPTPAAVAGHVRFHVYLSSVMRA